MPHGHVLILHFFFFSCCERGAVQFNIIYSWLFYASCIRIEFFIYLFLNNIYTSIFQTEIGFGISPLFHIPVSLQKIIISIFLWFSEEVANIPKHESCLLKCDSQISRFICPEQCSETFSCEPEPVANCSKQIKSRYAS